MLLATKLLCCYAWPTRIACLGFGEFCFELTLSGEMHELHVPVHCADSRYTEGDYARIDGGKACDGVKAVESTRRAEDGMGNWHERGWW